MVMDLRYLVKGMLLPPFLQILLFLFSWVLRRRYPRVAAIVSVVAVGSLWILGSPVTATYLARTLEKAPALKYEQLSDLQADAIIVLSSGQNEYAPEFGEPVSAKEQLSRIRYGVFLQRASGLPVLLSGGSVGGDEIRSLAETMAYDFEKGYGGKVRWLEKKSRTTAENGRYSFQVLAAENKTRVVLVTSAMHMMRATWSLEQAGFTVVPAPTCFTDQASLAINSFLPNASALDLSSKALHEWLGYIVYRLVE